MRIPSCDRFRPILDRVLVVFDEPETQTPGGLHIPTWALSPWEQHRPATVVAVGPGRFNKSGKRVPMQVRVGDRVLVHPHAHTVAPIVIRGVLHHVLDEWNKDGGEVFAVLGDQS